jgi:hypothetical protein
MPMAEATTRPEIMLVGVVHGDPGGYDKLKRLLERLRPRFISVEISEYSWRYRRRQEAGWQRQLELGRQSLPERQRRHMALDRVAAQIAYPFEVKVAEDYARQHGVGWLAVDLNSLAREHLPRYGAELLQPENLQHLVLTPDGDWGEYIQQEYRRARRGLRTGQDRAVVTVETVQARLREKVLAHRVARLAKQWWRLAHVGGWEHLVRGGARKTMADFLALWRPQRLLLDETAASRTGEEGPEVGE